MKGKLNCAKVAEAGKKVKKSWLQLWVILLPNSLVFYKDQKQSVPVSIVNWNLLRDKRTGNF